MSQIQLGTYRVMFTWSRGGTESGYRIGMERLSSVIGLKILQEPSRHPFTLPLLVFGVGWRIYVLYARLH